MTPSPYLDMLDDLLRPGIAGLSERFAAAQVHFVVGCQQSDGGFSGRQGQSDPYFTDFALRTLAWLAPDHAAFDRAAGYLACIGHRAGQETDSVPLLGTSSDGPNQSPRHCLCQTVAHRGEKYELAHLSCPPHNIVECFNLLNSRRLLERHASARTNLASPPGCVADTDCAAESANGTSAAPKGLGSPSPGQRPGDVLIEWLRKHLLPTGGFARFADDTRVSAYHTFLGSLCFQLLGVDMPAIKDATAAVAALKRPDGGYAELSNQTESQTSATAAAVAFLVMHDALSPEDAIDTTRYLAAMQSADGGLRPHAAVAAGDLLSTFTGLLTLSSLGSFHNIDAAAVARFLQRTSHPTGGFLACDGDNTPDVEYTYYGVGMLALLRVIATTET